MSNHFQINVMLFVTVGWRFEEQNNKCTKSETSTNNNIYLSEAADKSSSLKWLFWKILKVSWKTTVTSLVNFSENKREEYQVPKKCLWYAKIIFKKQKASSQMFDKVLNSSLIAFCGTPRRSVYLDNLKRLYIVKRQWSNLKLLFCRL